MFSLGNLFATEFFMAICTKMQPIEVSKFIFDLLLINQNYKYPEDCLMKLLEKCLVHSEDRILNLHGCARKEYLNTGVFITDCFNEFQLENLFLFD